MNELDGILAVLFLVVAAIVWLAIEVRRVYDAVQPLADSRLARVLAEV